MALRGRGAPSVSTLATAPPRAAPRAAAAPGSASDRARVTAILVNHNGASWLPATLQALGQTRRRPDRLIAVDSGSTDGSAALLQDSGLFERVIALPERATFAEAVAAAVAELPASPSDAEPPVATSDADILDWLWLLHDDCAPEPEALGALLSAARGRPSAGVLGPKVRGWNDRGLLIECGVSVTNSGRRFTGLELGDRDQGQRDHLSDVLAVGSAGMLVREDIWTALGGFDPALPMYGDDVEFCMRARRFGADVLVVPTAIVHHREATLHGVRSAAPSPSQVRHRRREAGMYATLVHGPAWLLPLTSLRLLIRTLLSALALLVNDGPARAWADLRVFVRLHLHPFKVLRARRRLRQVAQAPRRELAHLRPTLREQLAAGGERILVGLRDVLAPGTPEQRVGYGLGLGTALVLAAVLAVVAAIATRSILAATGALAGGALLPAPDGGALLQNFLSAWHDVGLGSDEPSAAYPLVFAAAAVLPLVSAAAAVQALLLGAVPLAAASCYLALRGLAVRPARVGLAIAYGLAPAVVVPSLDGRLGTAAVAVLLPWLVRLLARMLGSPGLEPVLGPPRLRTAAAASILLAVCASFAALVWPAAAAALLIGGAARARTRSLWLSISLVIVMPLLLLYPWSLKVITDPSRLMFEAGLSSPQLVADAPPGWRLLLLDPGTLSAGALWVCLPLAALAVAGLLRPRSRPLALWGWLLVLIGLVGATVQTSQKFVPMGATSAQHGFAGPMLILMALGMVVAAAAAVTGVKGSAVLPRPLILAAVLVALLAGPVAMSVQWMTQLSGPLARTDKSVVPAFVGEEALSTDRIRVLLMEEVDGQIAYALVNGGGGQLGDADVAPPGWTFAEVSDAVGALAAGVGRAPVETLAGNAVRYIVADTSNAALAGALDNNAQLRRLSTVEGRGLWKVDGVTARAWVDGPEGKVAVGMAGDDLARGVLVDGPVPGGEGAVLTIANTNLPSWRATVDGQSASIDGVHQLAVGLADTDSVDVLVEHEGSGRPLALLVPAFALLVLLPMLLPRRRLGSGYPDPDSAEHAGPAGPRPGPRADPAPEPTGTVDLTDSRPSRADRP